jgi:hypothetical protein
MFVISRHTVDNFQFPLSVLLCQIILNEKMDFAVGLN